MAKISGLLLLCVAVLLSTVQTRSQQEDRLHKLAATYEYGHEYGGSRLTLETGGLFSGGSFSHDGTQVLSSGTYVLSEGVLHFTILKLTWKRTGVEGEKNLLDPNKRKEIFGKSDTGEIKREFNLLPVAWSGRVYLIYEEEVNIFVNAINHGLEPRSQARSEPYYGAFYLRKGDELKRADGKPTLPARWLSYLLTKPVTATVIRIEESRKKTYGGSATATIDKGSRDGLRVGMRLLINDEEPSTTIGAEIISVGERTAGIRTEQIGSKLKVGDKLSTRNGPKLDEYNALRWNEEKLRLAKFAASLEARPNAMGYVVAYAGRRARAGEALARANRAREYLENELKIERGRIVVLDGGHRERQAVELFAVTAGSKPPEPTPTVTPSDVKSIKRRVKSNKRRAPRRSSLIVGNSFSVDSRKEMSERGIHLLSFKTRDLQVMGRDSTYLVERIKYAFKKEVQLRRIVFNRLPSVGSNGGQRSSAETTTQSAGWKG